MTEKKKTLSDIAAEYAEAVKWLESLPSPDLIKVAVDGAHYQVNSMLVRSLRQYLPQVEAAVRTALQEHVAQKRQALDEAQQANDKEIPHLRPVT